MANLVHDYVNHVRDGMKSKDGSKTVFPSCEKSLEAEVESRSLSAAQSRLCCDCQTAASYLLIARLETGT